MAVTAVFVKSKLSTQSTYTAVGGKLSSSGDKTLNLAAGEYTGREARQQTMTVSGTNVTSKTVVVTQNPKPHFAEWTDGNQSTKNWGDVFGRNAGVFSIGGKTNTKIISVSLQEIDSSSALSDRYECQSKFKTGSTYTKTLGGITAPTIAWNNSYDNALTINNTNGSVTSNQPNGDPGKIAEYAFTINLKVQSYNSAAGDVYFLLNVTGSDGTNTVTDQIIVCLSGTEIYLNLGATTITIPKEGTAQNLTITSNTDWSIQ